MPKLLNNSDVRAYATLHNVRLYEIADKLGITPSVLSLTYMRVEQTEETKAMLKRVVDEVVRERR